MALGCDHELVISSTFVQIGTYTGKCKPECIYPAIRGAQSRTTTKCLKPK